MKVVKKKVPGIPRNYDAEKDETPIDLTLGREIKGRPCVEIFRLSKKGLR